MQQTTSPPPGLGTPGQDAFATPGISQKFSSEKSISHSAEAHGGGLTKSLAAGNKRSSGDFK